MKKRYHLIKVGLFSLIASPLLSPYNIAAASNKNISSIELQDYISDPEFVQVYFTEEEMIHSLISQGFEVEKVNGESESRSVNATVYKVSQPLSTNKVRNGTGKINGRHYIYTEYQTIQGFNYFVRITTGGVELYDGNYYFSSNGTVSNLTDGSQGVSWQTSGQFYCSDSVGIALSAEWLSLSASATYNYYTPGIQESSYFHWPLIG